MSNRPSQNTGMEIPISENTMIPLSIGLFCFTAARIPRGTEKITVKTSDTIASFMVFGKRERTSLVTERLFVYDVPKSP